MGKAYDATVFPGGVVIPNHQIADWLDVVRTHLSTTDGMRDLLALWTDVLFGAGAAPACAERNRVHTLVALERAWVLTVWDSGAVSIDPQFTAFALVLHGQNRLYPRLHDALAHVMPLSGDVQLDLSGMETLTGLVEDDVDRLIWDMTIPQPVLAFLRGL